MIIVSALFPSLIDEERLSDKEIDRERKGNIESLTK